jgi:hypothetical protein
MAFNIFMLREELRIIREKELLKTKEINRATC